MTGKRSFFTQIEIILNQTNTQADAPSEVKPNNTVITPEPSEKEKLQLSSLTQLLRFIAPYKAQWIGAIVALLFTAGITLGIGQGVRLVIDNGFVTGSSEQLAFSIKILGLLAFLMTIGVFIRFYLMSWLGERASADIRQQVFDHLVTLHPSYFETNRSGDIMSRLTTDTTLLQTIIGSALSMALRNIVMVIGAVILLIITNLKLTLIILLSVPLIFIPILLFGKRVRTLSRESQDTIAEVGTYAGEVIQQIKTVQSYTHEEEEKKAFGKEVDNAFRVAKKRIAQRAFLIAAVILMVFGGICAMLWSGGNDVLNGEMSPGDLGAFVFYAMLVASGMGTLSEAYSQILQAVGATDRLMALMHADNEILPPKIIQHRTKDLKATLQLKDVTFNYPSRPDIPALQNFSLNIQEGKTLALVGPSGAGKSTVFELLQRFYDPEFGEINYDGVNIKEFSPQDLRKQIAVVAQHPALFTADVTHNIRYGNPQATDEQVIAAAKAAYAHEFILQLPQGYKSFLGEQGVRLSGGQKQRIAIARAILKNPRILLLDEATSALDTESEHQVQKALDELMSDRTTVIIAHRLSTVLHADSIAVIDEGRLVAQGKHDELIETNELYARLAELQFKTVS